MRWDADIADWVVLAKLVHGWGDLATAPPADLDDWTRRHVRDLAALETQWLPAAEGKTRP